MPTQFQVKQQPANNLYEKWPDKIQVPKIRYTEIY
jgi:hypothetical protein